MKGKHQEEKQVKLSSNLFLASLTHHGMIYQDYSPNTDITVVAVESYFGDWAAYFQTPYTPFGNVGDFGNKLPEGAAEQIFPDWAKRLKWRP